MKGHSFHRRLIFLCMRKSSCLYAERALNVQKSLGLKQQLTVRCVDQMRNMPNLHELFFCVTFVNSMVHFLKMSFHRDLLQNTCIDEYDFLSVRLTWPGLALMTTFKTADPKNPRKPSPAPVPLSIFRSNSKFDENSERSSFEYTRLITTIFCTRHDSDTVVTCAKYRCDRPRKCYTWVFWIFIDFRIQSKYV